jgi:hypothetical protein
MAKTSVDITETTSSLGVSFAFGSGDHDTNVSTSFRPGLAALGPKCSTDDLNASAKSGPMTLGRPSQER